MSMVKIIELMQKIKLFLILNYNISPIKNKKLSLITGLFSLV